MDEKKLENTRKKTQTVPSFFGFLAKRYLKKDGSVRQVYNPSVHSVD